MSRSLPPVAPVMPVEDSWPPPRVPAPKNAQLVAVVSKGMFV
eukprot:CAMPEP_0204127384 /NCGR_PEP_ID=MMETSP0361-20130328/11563_1 /ASSEMBLY_ACC=CAM_ASM_000343 /TAXON_ID=268821 /ORGANISM="Scrippsiella Hangoei, Strain SHTV-5" /LENGTH=41 /DNA_ID= /DNA_START= /DNA_END= /DNA_ORIENTATION=